MEGACWLQKWSLEWRENGGVTEIASFMEHGHVTEVVSLMEREWSCYTGDQFNGGRYYDCKKVWQRGVFEGERTL